MSRNFLRTAALATALSAACAAHASDDGFSWRFSGSGTAGYAATNSNDVLFANPGQFKGAQKGGSALVDSRLGGQLDFTFTPKLGATVQAIAMQDAKGRFRPQLEWGFLSYKASDNVTVRLGRLGWPAYLVSDYRYVGYANPWLRAPLEVYNLAPLDSYEGADLRWSHDVAGGILTVQALAGHASSPLPDTSERSARIKVNQLTGAYASYEIGNLRVRGGLSTGKATYVSQTTDMLGAGLGMAGYGELASRLLPAAAPGVRPTSSVRVGRRAPVVAQVAPNQLFGRMAEEASRLAAEGFMVGCIVAADQLAAAAAGLRAARVPYGTAERDGLGQQVTLLPAPAAKGLEFDAAVVVEPAAIAAAGAGPAARGLRLLYVALTRPIQHLSVVHSRPLPAGLADDGSEPTWGPAPAGPGRPG